MPPFKASLSLYLPEIQFSLYISIFSPVLGSLKATCLNLAYSMKEEVSCIWEWVNRIILLEGYCVCEVGRQKYEVSV